MGNVSVNAPAQPTYIFVQEPVTPVFNRVAMAVGSGFGSASAVHAYNVTASIVNDVSIGKIAVSVDHYVPVLPVVGAIIDTHKYNFLLIMGGIALAALCFKAASNYNSPKPPSPQ